MLLIGSFVVTILAQAFFEPALAAIGTNIVQLAVAGSDEVGSVVASLSAGTGSVDAGLFITNLIFGAGVPVGVHLATSTRFWRTKGDNWQSFFGEHEDEAL